MRNYLTILFLLVFVAGAQNLSAQKSMKYDLSAFTEITLKNNAKLILKQDSVQSVTVTATDEIFDRLVVENKDRKLIIRYSSNTWFDSKWNPGAITVYVSIPQIDELTVSGSGSIIADELISARVLDCYVSGSGSIRLSNLKAERITSGLSGSGHLQLAGENVVSEFKMSVSGSGNVKASGLKAKDVNVLISGSGNCAVYAMEHLNCKIAGSGNVTYSGNPEVNSTIVGSGKVREAK
jgi:hypothetical protein